MIKSKRTKIALAVVYILIGAIALFLCYSVVANFLAEKDRQANLDLWESQKQALVEQEAIDSSGETAGDSEYVGKADSSYDTGSHKEDYDMPAAEDFSPLKYQSPELTWSGFHTRVLKA